MSARRPGARPDPPGADAAARRLALIAADLGVGPPRTDTTKTGDAGAEPWWADHTRVAAPAAPPEPERTRPGWVDDTAHPPPAHIPPALPHPGRHAARRRRRTGPGVGPGSLVARLPGLGVQQVAVVALAVAAALALTAWWIIRDRAEPLTPVSSAPVSPLVKAAAQDAAPGPATDHTPEPSPGAVSTGAPTVTVDVAGKVRRPGIVVLPAGARVTDALTAAGGPRKGVDLTPLNLARVLVDGEQIVVGRPSGVGTASGPGSTGSTGSPGSAAAGPGAAAGPLVDLNSATAAELEALPQVGPVTAQAIVAWREAHGGFTSVDELLEVDGIGDKTLAQIAPHVTL